MASKDIKEEFHKLIDGFKDEDALGHFYNVMLQYQGKQYQTNDSTTTVNELKEEYHTASNNKPGTANNERDWWNDLSDKYKQELIDGLEEARKGINIVSHEEAVKRIQQWAKQ